MKTPGDVPPFDWGSYLVVVGLLLVVIAGILLMLRIAR